jgi:hypothetical protein
MILIITQDDYNYYYETKMKDPEYKTSSPNGIVYKLRSWRNPLHRKILLNNELWLSKPSDFNDPFDCQIFTVYSNFTDEQIKSHINGYILSSEMREQFLDPDLRNQEVNKIFTTRFKLSNDFQSISEKLEREHQDKSMGVLSMAMKWNNLLMWGHYGDCHKGICYGFNEKKLFESHLFGKAGKVGYSEDVPIIPLTNFADGPNNDFMKTVFTRLYTKAKHWVYEDEFRFSLTVMPELTNRAVIYPHECLEEIIFGLNMVKNDEDEIRKIIKSRNVRLFKIKKVPGKFEITREEVK